MSTRILIADKFEQSGIDALKSLSCEVISMPDVGAERLAGAIAEHKPTVLIVRSTKVQKAAIAAGAAAGLKGIVRAGAGVDNIDLVAASEAGIAACNCPGMNAAAVAELAFALLLAMDRRIVEQTIDLRAGKWNKKEYSKSRGVKGSTLGVIGLGSIGREVVKRAKAFGMNIIAHSLNMNLDRALDLGVSYGGQTRSELLKMLPRCDGVTIHASANPESEKMCDAAFFAAMKPGAYFINTSRGAVVDEAALAEAVKARGIRVASDVFVNEPTTGEASWNCALASLPGVIGTHHVGASTDQAQLAVAEETVRIVRVFRQTGVFENRVN